MTSGNVSIPTITAVRTSDVANLKPTNFVFRFLAHKERGVWRVLRVTFVYSSLFKKKKKALRIIHQCLHLGRWWKKTWGNYKNPFQFCSAPMHFTKPILIKPTSTTSVLSNRSYHVLDPLVCIGPTRHLLYPTANTDKYDLQMDRITSENCVQKLNSNRNCLYLLRTKIIYQWLCYVQTVLGQETELQEKSGFLCLPTSQEYCKGRPVRWTVLYPTSFNVHLLAHH